MNSLRTPVGFSLYAFVVTVAFLVAFPLWLLGLVTRPGQWRSRIGMVPRLAAKPSGGVVRVWVHASSVGEVRAATRLVKEMSERCRVDVVFSTMTVAGYSVARASLREPVQFFFIPLDVPFIVKRALERVEADVLLLVETELWPSLIFEAKKRGMKVVIINGKVGARGMRGYARFRFLFRPVLCLLDAVMVQSERHARNFESLGTPRGRITITGSTKQDWQVAQDGGLALRQRAGWSASEIVFAAGSTRPGEERALCEGFICAKTSLDGLRLILAPRHLRRSSHVARLAASFGLSVARWSSLGTEPLGLKGPRAAAPVDENVEVVILDTIGDLIAAYGESDVAFIGGTLSGHGGHNVLEPAAAGLPVLAGPSRENIEDDCNALAARGALVTVKNPSDVCRELLSLAPSEERERRGKEALSFFRSRPVASLLTLEHLQKAGVL